MSSKLSKNLLLSIVAIVLVLAVALVAVVNIPSQEQSNMIDNETVGTNADSLSAVSVDDEKPLEMGSAIPNNFNGYTAVYDNNSQDVGVKKFNDLRTSNTTGNYYLYEDITVSSVDTASTFAGILDGNGKTITIKIEDPSSIVNGSNFGGLFANLTGTIKNVKIVIENFRVRLNSAGTRVVGGVIGTISDGALENVYVEFQYSPEKNATASNEYYVRDNGTHKGAENVTEFGGIVGKLNNGSLNNITVFNNTSNAGVSVHASVNESWWKGKTDVHAGLVIGILSGNNNTINNITMKTSSTAKFTLDNSGSGGFTVRAGLILGKAEGQITINGIIFDNSYSNNISNFVSTTNSQDLVGFIMCEGNATIKNLYSSFDSDKWGGYTDKGYGKHGIINTNGIVLNFGLNPNNNYSPVIYVEDSYGTPLENVTALYNIGNGDADNQYVLSQLVSTEKTGTAYVLLNMPTNSLTMSSDSNTQDWTCIKEYAKTGSISVDTSQFVTEKTYDNKLPNAPKIVLGEHAYENSYICSNISASYNEIPYTFEFNLNAINDAKLIEYENITYIIKGEYIYSSADFDKNTTYSTQINKAPLKVALSLGDNNIIYQDSLSDITNKVVNVVALDDTQYYGTATFGDVICMAGDLAYSETMPAGTKVTLTADSVIPSDGNDNYDITIVSSEYEVQKLQIQGTLTGIENLVFDGSDKLSLIAFNADGYDFEYSYSFTKDGAVAEQLINAGTYSVEVNCLDESVIINEYVFEFAIAQKPVEITTSSEAVFSAEYNGTEVAYQQLFVAPNDINSQPIALNFSITKGEEVQNAIKNAGTYTITVSLVDNTGNYIASNLVKEFVITAKSISIEKTGVNSTVYNGQEVSQEVLKSMFTAPTDIQGMPFELTVSVSEGVIVKDANTYIITANVVLEGENAINYVCESVQDTFTINAKEVSGQFVLPENLVYDKQAKQVNYVANEGFELCADDVFTITYKQAEVVESAINAGEYSVEVSLPNANYVFAQDAVTTTTMTITPAKVQIVANEAQSVDYSGVTFSDFVNLFSVQNDLDEAVNIEYVVNENKEVKNVGVYTITASVSDNNYTGDSVFVDYTINKVDATVTAQNASATYGQPNPEVTAVVEGAVNGEQLVYEVSIENSEKYNVGEYAITVSFDSENEVNKNYNISTVDAVLTVNKADASITANAIEVVYGDEIPEATAVAEGEVNGDKLVYTITVDQSDKYVVGGDYNIVITFDAENEANKNYNITSNNAKLTVTKASATITIGDYSLIYGEDVSEFVATLAGSVPTGIYEESLSYSVSVTEADKYVVGGDYTLSISLVQDEVSANYEVNVEDTAKLIIDKREVTPVISSDDHTYDGTAKTANYSFDNIVDGDNLTITLLYDGTSAPTDYKDGGYVVTVDTVAGLGGTDAGNYTLGSANEFTMYVNKKAVTVNATVTEQEYTGEVIAFEFAIKEGDVIEADKDFVTLSAPAYTQGGQPIVDGLTNVGTYIAAFTLSGDKASNYEVENTVIVQITPAHLDKPESMSIEVSELIYNGQAQTATLVYEGEDKADYKLVYTDTVSGQKYYGESAPINVGSYTVQVYYQDDLNKIVSDLSATMTISPKALTSDDFVIQGNEVVYDGTQKSVSVVANELSENIFGEDVVNVTAIMYDGQSEAPVDYKDGGYAVTITVDNANYSVEDVQFVLTINKATVTITASNASKEVVYGSEYTLNANDFGVQANLEGFEVEIVASYAGESYTTSTNAGTTLEVNFSVVLKKDGIVVDNENYNVDDQTACSVYVTTAELEISGNNASAEFKNDAFSIDEIKTAIFGENANKVNIVVTEGEVINVGVYNITATSADSNYVLTGTTEYTFEVVAKEVELNATKQSVNYSAEKTYTKQDIINAVFGVETVEGVVFKVSGFESDTVANSGTYTVEAVAENGNYNVVVNGVAEFVINKATVDAPVVSGTYTYNGVEQTVVLEGSNYTVVGGNKATNAGDYSVEVALADSNNYMWSDETTENNQIVWTIEKAKATIVANALEAVYGALIPEASAVVTGEVNGEKLVYTVAVEESDSYVVGGDYNVVITFDEENEVNKNYNITKTDAKLTITKATVETPVVSGAYTYNGTEQTVVLEGSNYAVVGGDKATNAGNYSVEVALADSNNYMWSDGTAKNKQIAWSISAKNVTLTIENATKIYDGELFDFTNYAVNGVEGFVESDNVVVTVSAKDADSAVGVYNLVITTTADDNSNYVIQRSEDKTLTIVSGVVSFSVNVGYENLTINVDNYQSDLEYKLGDGEWTVLPEDGKVAVQLASEWSISVRYAQNDYTVATINVAITSEVVSEYIEKTYSGEASFADKELLSTVKAWAEKATGDKTQLSATIAQIETAYNDYVDSITQSVEDALTVTGNLTSKLAIALATVATTFVGVGIAVGAIVLSRKGGKKNENK